MAVAPSRPAKASVGPVLYGSQPATGTIGSDRWSGHNSAQTWDDGGASEKIVDKNTADFFTGLDNLLANFKTSLTQDVQEMAGAQVREAVGEYIPSVSFAVGIADGQLVVAVTAANDQASITAYTSLIDLFADARTKAMADPTYNAALQQFGHLVGTGLAKPQATHAGSPVAPPKRKIMPANPARPVAAGAFAEFGMAPLTRKG